MRVVIMRGLPGSGKSTYARGLSGSKEIFSADDWHTHDGGYKYDPLKAAYAHTQCLACYMTCLRVEKATEVVVVDNTNTTAVELAPYVRIAEAFGVEYEIVYMYCDFLKACARNTHNVPETTIHMMQSNLLTERLPAYWKQRIVVAHQLREGM